MLSRSEPRAVAYISARVFIEAKRPREPGGETQGRPKRRAPTPLDPSRILLDAAFAGDAEAIRRVLVTDPFVSFDAWLVNYVWRALVFAVKTDKSDIVDVLLDLAPVGDMPQWPVLRDAAKNAGPRIVRRLLERWPGQAGVGDALAVAERRRENVGPRLFEDAYGKLPDDVGARVQEAAREADEIIELLRQAA